MTIKTDLWENLIQEYNTCKICTIGENAKTHVFGRGSLSPHVVFVGEGPGKLEDIKGKPFVGLAGQLLSSAINDSGVRLVSYFFTNLVSCRPCDQVGGPNRAPSDEEIENCSERLKSTLTILSPKVVVLLGRIPRMFLLNKDYVRRYKVYCLEHPAYILRMGGLGSERYKHFVEKIKEVLTSATV